MDLPVLAKLKKELADLKHELTFQIPKDLQTAAAHGDLSENAEYDAAKNRQDFVRSRIGQLDMVGSINLKNNDALTSLPSLAKFELLDAIFIIDNDGLEELDLDLVNVYPRGFFDVGTFSRGFRYPTQRVEVQGNASLRRLRLAGTHGLTDIQFLTVADNPALAQIDFPHLEKVDQLIVNSNATLSSVSVPRLKTVDTLEITNNPALSEAAFDYVKTFETLMSGNATP